MTTPSIPTPHLSGLPAGADPNFGDLFIKDDTLYPKDATPYTYRDICVGLALFVISQVVPIISSLILTISRKSWWKRKWFWSMSRLVVLWLASVQIVALVVFNPQAGSTRFLFLIATLHLQTEYIIIAFLVGASPLVALGVAYAVGIFLMGVQLLVVDLSVIFIITSVFGLVDFMIPLLFLYGKQWLYAMGGLAHLVQAFALFCTFVKDYGHMQYAAINLFTTMIMNGALVTALLRAIKEPQAKTGPIRVGDGEEYERQVAPKENPLAGIEIPRNTLILLFAASLVGGTASGFIYTFIVAGS